MLEINIALESWLFAMGEVAFREIKKLVHDGRFINEPYTLYKAIPL